MRPELDEREVAHHRQRLDETIAATPAYPADRFSGRGIVICAGGARMLTGAWVTIGVLRRVLGCELPIEVWHIGRDEMGTDIKAILEETGAEVVDAVDVARTHPMRTLGGWELKPYALTHSRFREVLLLDADNIPVVDPGFLFDTAEYGRTGTLFWPDVVRLARDNPIWDICQVPFADEWSVESGQVVVDKLSAWTALQLCVHMNAYSDFYYRFVYGDKETFYLAWRRARAEFARIPHAPKRTHYGLVQLDVEGRPVFQHRMDAKWVLRGENRSFENFTHDSECLALLEELRHKWDGRIFHPPPQRPSDVEVERRLAGARFLYRRVSKDEREIELLPANRIGVGRDAYEQRWYVIDGDSAAVLVIEGEGRLTCRLREAEDGTWLGRWERSDKVEVELVPLEKTSSVRPAYSGSKATAYADGNWTVNYQDAQ